MATSGNSDDKMLCFSMIMDPQQNVSQKTIIKKFEVIENFYSDLPRINIGWKSNNEVFSPRKSYHKIQI